MYKTNKAFSLYQKCLDGIALANRMSEWYDTTDCGKDVPFLF